MKTHSNITEEELNRLLGWLGGGHPDEGARRYETIRRGLITVFISRRCQDAEDLADETIDRVAKKLGDIADSYVGDPARYFYGVAKKVVLEYTRQKLPPVAPVPTGEPGPQEEPDLDCLDACLERLTAENRELILSYYGDKKRRKSDSRERLRRELSLKAGALRARTFRIRAALEKCVRQCLAERQESNNSGANLIR
jgi:DNA-directed RNA polymerase specialized sigma24 family protein